MLKTAKAAGTGETTGITKAANAAQAAGAASAAGSNDAGPQYTGQPFNVRHGKMVSIVLL
jgi:hypothetical protein